ncbi:plexin-B-like [Anneissia japonica]|uniref:plexin-B-like n=1 Tax=Anneissia japonica TaxID=1529436 RepID=UPI00142557BF|nr:plexin-B-like [Anneissia japonica]
MLTTSDELLGITVNIISKSSARVYENITLDAGQEVRSDTFLDKTSNQLMVLTETMLLKLPVANCSQFTTCDECIRPTGDQDGDPYCGWCTLQKICTRFKECKSSYWLPGNTAQCIQITDVEPPFVHYTDEHVKVKLTVEQLPPLNANQNYSCKFGDFVSPGLKDGKTITCTSPPRTQVPQIPNKEAAVEVSLSVHSSQTDVDFVTTQFRFFDCSAITFCSECVTSFTCDWCLYGNTCTQNASAFCSTDDQVILNGNATVTPVPGGMKGHDSCPQIIRQTNEELIHASLVKEVRIPVKNLPNATKVPIVYECVLTIEGKTSNIPASVEESNITCSQYTVRLYPCVIHLYSAL